VSRSSSTPSILAGPWRLKLFYLSFFLGSGVYFPYLGLYYHAINLSAAQIGLLASLSPVASVLLQPLWGVLSDRYHLRRQLLIVCLLCSAVLAPIVALAHAFVPLLLLILALSVALSPVSPLADATTLEWLRRHGGSYGAVRIYGSLSFLLTSLAVGSFYTGTRISWLFPLYGAFLFLTFLVSFALPGQEDTVQITGNNEGVGALLSDRAIVVFLLLACLGYSTYAAYNTFLALYLKGLGAGTTAVGLAWGLGTLSELPVMAFAGRAIARLGVKPLLLFGFGVACLRWTAYGLLHDYRVAVFVSALHGFCFATYYVAGVTYVDTHVPARLRATGQAMFNAATFGLGSILGANLFGSLYDRFQAHAMFLVAGAICLLAVVGIAVLVPGGVLRRRVALEPSSQQ
jgi:PPP family 3-phenylpropionic acid transporter